MNPIHSIHTDNSSIRPVSKAEMSWLCISMLWQSRRDNKVRKLIKEHVSLIRKGENKS